MNILIVNMWLMLFYGTYHNLRSAGDLNNMFFGYIPWVFSIILLIGSVT